MVFCEPLTAECVISLHTGDLKLFRQNVDVADKKLNALRRTERQWREREILEKRTSLKEHTKRAGPRGLKEAKGWLVLLVIIP